MKDIILFLSLILWVSMCLHIKNHESPESYLASLKSQQQSVTDQIASLKKGVQDTLSSVGSQSDISEKIKILEQAILKQKSQLSQLARSTNVDLNESSWTCENYEATSEAELGGLVNQIIDSTSKIESSINNISNKTTQPFFTPDSNAASESARDLQKKIYSDGKQVDNLNNTKETNWLAPNWITGTKTLPQVEQENKEREKSTGYIETCPLENPFYDGNNCISCPSANYFNIENKKCEECKNYVASNRTCYTAVTPSSPNITNFNSGSNRIILPAGTDIGKLTNQTGISCPNEKPFLVNGNCINCESPNSLFNYTSKQCTTCPSGSTFVQDKHSCVGANQTYVTNLPKGANRLILPEGTTISDIQQSQQQVENAITCPDQTPFFNNKTCINCENSQYFNVQSLTCQGCQDGAAYNETLHRCIKATFYSNLKNQNWTSTNPEGIINETLQASKREGAVPCPESTPFFDGSKCTSCPANQYFSFDGTKCESCSSNTVFSVNQHSCVEPETGLYQTNVTTAPNLIYDGTSKGEWVTIYRQNEQKNPQITDCPTTRPYFDGIRCIACPASYPYFNLRYKVCQVCDEGSTYNFAVKECLSSSGDIISQHPNIEKMIASIFT